MYKHITLVFILKIIGTTCDRSFAVVVDTSFSMNEELNVIKANIGQVVNSIQRTDIDNYILVAFKDTVVESPFITENPALFTSQISTLTTSGGSDCPENTLAGIEAALRASKQESFIFVFTDAYAKDYDRFRTIEALCTESHSQVIIFLSGFCLPSETSVSDLNVYYDVAKVCSGAFFRFDRSYDLRQGFKFMKKAVNIDWTDIAPQETFTDNSDLSFSVDSFTSDFLIAVSGSYVAISISDSNSQQLRSPEKVLLTRHAQVVYLYHPNPGNYSVSIRGHGVLCVTFYDRNYIPFEYGFSTKLPRSLKETSLRPLAGWQNYLMISIDKSIKLQYIEWLNAGGSAKEMEYLEERSPGVYVTGQHFVEPRKSFRIWLTGQDIDTRLRIRSSTKQIFPQEQVANSSWYSPVVEILDPETNLVDYGTAFTTACKVLGFQKPKISWEDGKGSILFGEDVLLEIPSVYISYLTISNMTDNSTIYCKAEDTIASASLKISQHIDVFVNRTFSFEIFVSPQDTTVEYGEDLSLSCHVNAYPDAKVEWHFNSTKLDPNFNSKAVIEGNNLVVSNVSIEDGGSYDCVASNDVETRILTAVVSISGLETPTVRMNETELVAKPGDWIGIECRVTGGNPEPKVAWQYKTTESFEFTDLPIDVTVEGDKIEISSVDKNHGGVYKCTASNIIGEDSKEASLSIQFAPIIQTNEVTTLTVTEGDTVQLRCDVEAVPEATARWEMSQDDVSITLGKRHRIDDQHTLSFTSFWNDSGNYHCVAENSVGRTEMTITLNVLVPPYIEAPKSKTVRCKVGGQVDLPCTVLYGSPTPTIKWEFVAVDSIPKAIARGNATLHLENVSQINEGSYVCIAENRLNTDRIRYSLKIYQ